MFLEKHNIAATKPPLSASFDSRQGMLACQFVDRIRTKVKNLSRLPTVEQGLFFVSHGNRCLINGNRAGGVWHNTRTWSIAVQFCGVTALFVDLVNVVVGWRHHSIR